jgi:hypothetical protein
MLVSTPNGFDDAAAILSRVMVVLPVRGGGLVWAFAMLLARSAATANKQSLDFINNRILFPEQFAAVDAAFLLKNGLLC